MAYRSKRYRKEKEKVDSEKLYRFDEACDLVCKTGSAKFDESVEISIRLGIDAKKTDQTVRGSAPLPHGLGKKIRVAVFAKGDKAKEAEAAGADFVGGDDLVDKIKGGFFDFESVVATPDMMVQVGKVGKLLGPRGLMPAPKLGTVTFDVANTIKSLKAGRAEFRAEKAGIVHCIVGKVSFGSQKIRENVLALTQVLNKQKPSNSKGVYLRSACMASTMGPGVRFDLSELRDI